MENIFETLEVFWVIIKSLWWLWLIAFGISLIPIYFRRFERWISKRRAQKWLEEHRTLEEWKRVGGLEFEEIVAIIFEKLGYKTKIRRNGGIDIIAQKDGKRIFFQCKNMDRVIPDHVRAFWGSIEAKIKKGEGEKGIFITTGSFTEGIKEWVKDKPIELIDGLKLEDLARN